MNAQRHLDAFALTSQIDENKSNDQAAAHRVVIALAGFCSLRASR
jgi:hypothetical protein